jgi:hypothetical protein
MLGWRCGVAVGRRIEDCVAACPPTHCAPFAVSWMKPSTISRFTACSHGVFGPGWWLGLVCGQSQRGTTTSMTSGFMRLLASCRQIGRRPTHLSCLPCACFGLNATRGSLMERCPWCLNLVLQEWMIWCECRGRRLRDVH